MAKCAKCHQTVNWSGIRACRCSNGPTFSKPVPADSAAAKRQRELAATMHAVSEAERRRLRAAQGSKR